MEWLALLLKLGHVLVAFALVAGMVGRWILLTRASRADDVEQAHLLADAASPFERAVQVPLVFIPRGRVFESAMADARGAGRVTDGLRSAWADPAVALARRYELAAVVIIVALMVLKPF